MERSPALEPMAETQTVSIDIDLRRLSQVCLPRWDGQITFPRAPNEKWIRVLRLLRAAICREGESLDHFLDKLQARYIRQEGNRVLRCVAAILYDQECCGDPITHSTETEFGDTLPSDSFLELWYLYTGLFAHMLPIDYGIGADPFPAPTGIFGWLFWRNLWPMVLGLPKYLTEVVGRWRQGHIPDWAGWDYLNSRLRIGPKRDLAEDALMYYYYATYRRQVDPADYGRGTTGYTGVLQQMIAEVPTRGTDRLARKLCFDVRLIPTVIKEDRKKRLMAMVEDLAAQPGICLYASEADGLTKDPVKGKYKTD